MTKESISGVEGLRVCHYLRQTCQGILPRTLPGECLWGFVDGASMRAIPFGKLRAGFRLRRATSSLSSAQDDTVRCTRMSRSATKAFSLFRFRVILQS